MEAPYRDPCACQRGGTSDPLRGPPLLYNSLSSNKPMDRLTSLIPERTNYNGWANWATWNVALWIQNDEATYKVAKHCNSYDRLIPRLETMWGQMTPDGARWMDGTIDTAALNEMLADL